MAVWGRGARRGALGLASGVTGALALASAAAASPTPVAAAQPAATPVASAASLKVLGSADAQRYGQAFAAMHRGDYIAGQNMERQLSDPCLIGRLEAARLLNPNYRANYGELAGWMDRYADLPEAERVYDLALKRKPANAAAPRQPATAAAEAPSPVGFAERVSRSLQGTAPAASAGQRAARDAFYRGDMAQAYVLGSRSGERWIAGLAAMQMKRYADALTHLEALSGDVRQSPWVRSGAAYWGARAAAAQSDKAKARVLLKVAARSPDTFYGLIAARELDQLAAKSPQADAIADVLEASTLNADDTAAFARTDPRAHRAAALMQIGLPLEAGEELRTAMTLASDVDRPRLTSLALALNAPLGVDPAKAGWARFDAGHFPTPVLNPLGGFTVDKALIYALVRQESRFDPNAASGSAYGLMQLTAETAARLAGDASLRRNPAQLRDPALNLKLGQAYVTKLLASVQGDVMKAVAAYNGGPGVIQKLAARMGANTDSLMMVESIPSGQTRDYVQRVMAYYWIYRQIFGQDSKSLSATASGGKALAAADF